VLVGVLTNLLIWQPEGRWKPWRHPLPTATKLVLQLQFLLWFLYSVSMCGVRFVGGIVGAAGAVVSALTL
jgi:hypothetical protein